jgi:hypothetical protein
MRTTVNYPKILRVRQTFERHRVGDVAAAVTAALESLDLPTRIRPGQSVALTAGSRGIANIPQILKSTVEFLKRLGANPFLVPAMGSHGGATAEGQHHLLESYGVTESFVGAPIRSSMEVVPVGTTSEGYPVVLDRHAASADHIGVIGRVKPHTGYHGKIESGLMKMMMIGLGKHAGALTYHRILLEEPYDAVVRSVGRTMMAAAPVSFGLGIVENGYDETARLEGVQPADFESREEALLTLARDLLGRLPLRQADLLIVDEIGKDISGSGMDTNVVGRKRAFRNQVSPADLPVMRQIFVRGLTAKTHGNATGIGNADFTTARLVEAMDYRATVINCLTAGYPEGASLPVHFPTDREAVEAALEVIGRRDPKDARILHIRNTLDLEELEVSEPCLSEPHQTTFTPVSSTEPLDFSREGGLNGVKTG